MDRARIDQLSEMAEASEDVALELAAEIALSGAYDMDAWLAGADAIADEVMGRRAFQTAEAGPEADLDTLAEDAGF